VYRTGVTKPAFSAYRIPIFVVRSKKSTTVFGQIRPVRRGTARAKVEIQNRPRHKPWKTVRTLTTNKRGYILTRFARRGGSWRIKWVEPDGTISFSRGSTAVPPTTPSTPGLPPPGSGTPPSPDPPSTDPGTPPPAAEEPPAPPPPPQYTLSVMLELHDDVLMRPASGKVTSNPAGIDCGTTCSTPYSENTVVTLEAVPDPGTRFDGWSGEGCPNTGTTCTVTMSMARSVQASFTRDPLSP
jgi:hypothetical protein